MKAVLFDFDFTLADSSKGILECVRHALASSGLPVPEDHVVLSTVGMSLRECWSITAPGADPKALNDLFIERADQMMADVTWVYESVPSVMEELTGRGYATGIVSTKFRYRIESILARDSMLHLFDVIVGGEDVELHKPHPDALIRAFEILGCSASEAVYVGDTVTDAAAASAVGTGFIAVCSGPTPRSAFEAHGVETILDSLPQVTSVLR